MNLLQKVRYPSIWRWVETCLLMCVIPLSSRWTALEDRKGQMGPVSTVILCDGNEQVIRRSRAADRARAHVSRAFEHLT
jgi:hypothetical protein